MEFFEKIGNTLSNTSKEVAKRTKDVTDTSKISLKINSEKAALQKKYQQAGETYYRQYLQTGIADEKMEAFCKSIKESINIIKDYNRQIQYIKGVPMCFVCGKEISNKAIFCKHCGYRTDRSVAEKEEAQEETSELGNKSQAFMDAEIAEGKLCSKCNCQCEGEDLYCSNCGNQLKEKDEYI